MAESYQLCLDSSFLGWMMEAADWWLVLAERLDLRSQQAPLSVADCDWPGCQPMETTMVSILMGCAYMSSWW